MDIDFNILLFVAFCFVVNGIEAKTAGGGTHTARKIIKGQGHGQHHGHKDKDGRKNSGRGGSGTETDSAFNSRYSVVNDEDLPDEQRLVKRVFAYTDYDNTVRPVYNATDNVVVRFGLTLIQVMDMDEKNQVMVNNVWLTHEWRDERISWNPADYSGLEKIRIPAAKLWLPDIVLYNNADDYTTGYMPANAMVDYTGNIFWSPPARLRCSCKVDITYFPFDVQGCKMKFGSWTYDKSQVDLVNSSEAVDMGAYITNGEWKIIGSKITRNEVTYPIGSEIYPDVTVTIVISRRVLYYIINIIFPCVWLNVLSLLAFCIPPDSGEKVTLGITVLLSYSVFMLLVADSMPATSEFVPLIGIYLTVSMAVTSISVILTVFILNLHHCGPHQKKVPKWVRVLVLHHVAGMCGLSCCHRTTRKEPRKIPVIYETNSHNFKANNVRSEPSEVFTKLVGHDPTQGVNAVRFTPEYSSPRNSTRDLKDPYGDGFDDIDEKRLTPLEEILKYLRIMVMKRDEDDNEIDIVNEWRHVAAIMDRFFFIVFMTLMTLSTTTLLVFIPMGRPGWHEPLDR